MHVTAVADASHIGVFCIRNIAKREIKMHNVYSMCMHNKLTFEFFWCEHKHTEFSPTPNVAVSFMAFFCYVLRKFMNRRSAWKTADPCSDRPDDGGSKHLWNVGKRHPDYTMQQLTIFVPATVRTSDLTTMLRCLPSHLQVTNTVTLSPHTMRLVQSRRGRFVRVLMRRCKGALTFSFPPANAPPFSSCISLSMLSSLSSAQLLPSACWRPTASSSP
jgi:hypothetical protein